ncbi:TPA: hypothetical protein SAW06_001733 [Campylobacter jejuni]|uniref:hypothetical protein n=9 Tax=Campylobacter jejuni TaxID=197 RepID=UPI000699D662|nr:hypothetical protein [Campylobacter jejuni]EAJ8161473.1 hypothetical protein [Campylobacter jejuni]ECL3590953.1 hypothetical protein [Campylobacter jejuni]HEC3431623.1 hypothetical protein [Campylobacter jejuni]HEF2369548.1 hypothetical protein [Campylobacter jejuni]HEF6362943.1 hypothetical protein [Campylobacter jejuni]
MSETYKIYTPNGIAVKVDKETNKIYFVESLDSHPPAKGNYTEEYSKALFEAHNIKRNSPYKDYKPQYLDPEFYTGQSSTLLEFKEWQNIYLKDPIKGAIAPWTKAEKAYYKSLKTKRERYKYLAIRSGLRSVVIDIPYEAIGAVDEKGNVDPKYEKLYRIVDDNKHNLRSSLFHNEWGMAAGILGDYKYLANDMFQNGFNARFIQATILYIQLSGGSSILDKPHLLGAVYGYADIAVGSGLVGVHKNPLREQEIKTLAKTLKPDEFGMLPFIDEIMGVDWVIDYNKYRIARDEFGSMYKALRSDIVEGKIKDPRDIDSTYESRREFDHHRGGYYNGMVNGYGTDTPNDWSEERAQLFNDTLILHAKLAALTPPQGYPNAPYYFTPENLEWYYKRHKLDRLLDPRIPAIYRYNFPQELRAKIRAYAKEHNIKE